MKHARLVQHSLTDSRHSFLFPVLLVSLSLGLLLVACDGGAQADREATVVALGQLVEQTATAVAGDDLSSQDLLATAEAAATAAMATISAVSTEAAESAATAAAVAAALPPDATPSAAQPGVLSPEAVASELILFGLDPSVGDLVWAEPTAVLAGEGLQQFQPDSPFAAIPLQNFAVVADITSGQGTTACGFTLRATNLEQLSDQHLLLISPGEPGGLTFQTWQNGLLAPDEVSGAVLIDPAAQDPQFSLAAGATNRLAVVAGGEAFTIYSNGVLVAELRPLVQLAAGQVALTGLDETGGVADCRFGNAWLWALDVED
jgi:hypothetical protein